MQLKHVAPQPLSRFQLTIMSYPNEDSIRDVCELIYDSRDKNLIRSLSALPYVIGRSFPTAEVHRLNPLLKDLRVGHEFKNLVGEGELILFNPNAEAVQPTAATATPIPTKSTSTRTKINKYSIVGAVAGLIVMIGLSFVLKYKQAHDSTAAHAPANSKVHDDRQATLEEITRDVEFRLHQNFLWKKAEINMGLVEDDGLRTYDNSTAVIRYVEGSRVFVRPNTMMIVGKAATPDDRHIRLEDGTLQARLKPSTTSTTLAIETKSGTLEVKSPKIGEAVKEARIETKMNGESFQVRVSEGTATLKPVAANAVPIQIQNYQEVVATPSNVTPPTAFIPTIELYSPHSDETITVNPDLESQIVFRWEAIGDNATYSVDIASDIEMKNSLLHQEVKAPEMTIHYLDPGPAYWQIVTTFEGTLYKSLVRKLNVQEHHN